MHCLQRVSVCDGLPQPLLLLLKCINSTRREVLWPGNGKNIIVGFAKKNYEIFPWFCLACDLGGFSERRSETKKK